MLTVDKLSFGFDENTILDEVGFEVGEGEILCLLGPNGCGKTTLLNCITSYYGDYEGTVSVQGLNARRLSYKERAKLISYVPQMTKESFPYTVFDIILMGRTPYTRMFGAPSKKDERIVDEVIEYLSIDHLRNRTFNELSGGESQLVKIGRGLAQKAKVHVLDEPTAALDLKNELQLLQTLTELVTKQKNTVIMATHYPNQPLYFENKGLNVKVCMMRGGRVLYHGVPSEVIHTPSLRDIYDVDAHVLDFEEHHGKKGHYVVPLRA